mmetsp:Transcript_17380/g.20057  ORF Transcript_17380/g.20057 Transcript_17380/m.20057 type:complete len:421 (-) Transcript_17380:458-1720(-)
MGQKNAKLMHATQIGNVEDMRDLIEKNGKNPNRPNESGITPLHLACAEGYEKIAKYLLKNCEDVNIQTKANGFTPLHCVCANGPENHDAIIKQLLRKGANPNIKDIYGAIPLHYASYQGKDGAVKLLLENGSNPNILNNDGKTPKEYASSRGNILCYEILEAAEREITIFKDAKAKSMESIQRDISRLENAEIVYVDNVDEERYENSEDRGDKGQRQAIEVGLKEKQYKRKKLQKTIEDRQMKQDTEKVELQLRKRREKFLISDKCSTLSFKVINKTTGKYSYILLAVSPEMTLQSLYSKLSGLSVKKFPKKEHLELKAGERTLVLRITDPTLKEEYFLVTRDRFDQFTTVDIIDNLPEESKNPVHIEIYADYFGSDDDDSLFDPSFSVASQSLNHKTNNSIQSDIIGTAVVAGSVTMEM